MAELAVDIHIQIQDICQKGDSLSENGHCIEALKQYWSAWELLPEPRTEWDAATWILTAIGDVNYFAGDYIAGRDNLSFAMRCPGAIGNPFLHLRLGQCQFELSNLGRAADELALAFMGAGSEIFEDEDNKYFEFLKTRLEPPMGGWER